MVRDTYHRTMKKLLSTLLGLLFSVNIAQAVPHIFNGDSPVVLVQETEFHFAPYYNELGETGTTLVVGKALGGIGTDIAPGSVVLLRIQGKSDDVAKNNNERRLFIAQVNSMLARPLHPDGSIYYVDGYDFTCFCAQWLLQMNPEELKPEWLQLQKQVNSILNPSPAKENAPGQMPPVSSLERKLFTACSKMQANAGGFDTPAQLQNHEVYALLKAGANVNARCNERGMTPLMQAALHNDSFSCTLLLKAGADPNMRDVDGMTALNYAIIGCNIPTKQLDALRAILPWAARTDQHCTPPQGTRYSGATALHHAVLSNSSFIVWELLRWGADATAKDDAGRTPLELAKELGSDRGVMEHLLNPPPLRTQQ